MSFPSSSSLFHLSGGGMCALHIYDGRRRRRRPYIAAIEEEKGGKAGDMDGMGKGERGQGFFSPPLPPRLPSHSQQKQAFLIPPLLLIRSRDFLGNARSYFLGRLMLCMRELTEEGKKTGALSSSSSLFHTFAGGKKHIPWA